MCSVFCECGNIADFLLVPAVHAVDKWVSILCTGNVSELQFVHVFFSFCTSLALLCSLLFGTQLSIFSCKIALLVYDWHNFYVDSIVVLYIFVVVIEIQFLEWTSEKFQTDTMFGTQRILKKNNKKKNSEANERKKYIYLNKRWTSLNLKWSSSSAWTTFSACHIYNSS